MPSNLFFHSLHIIQENIKQLNIIVNQRKAMEATDHSNILPEAILKNHLITLKLR